MPKWLMPWLLPIAMVTAVLVGFASSSLGLEGSAIVWFLFVLAVYALLVRLRLRYLKQHPPEPELQHKPFWRF